MTRTLAQFFSRKHAWLGRARTNQNHNCRIRPAMLRLEDRTVPAVFTVTNTDDNGAGSLRQVVIDANAAAGADTVAFSSLFNSPQTINLLTELPHIAGDLTITGTGSDKLTVRRDTSAPNFRVFTVDDGSAAVIDATLSGMTISNGKTQGYYFPDAAGAGVYVSGERLTLDSVRLVGNSAAYQGGGVCVAYGGELVVRDSTVSGNSGYWGGGVYAFYSSVLIDRCTVSGNHGTNGLGGGIGGSGSDLNIRDSTIAQNSADWGGGIEIQLGRLTVDRSAVINNDATEVGGGIYNEGGSVVLRNSTVSGNVMTSGGSGAGVGLPYSYYAASLVVQNSTIAGNSTTGYGGGIAAEDASAVITLESSVVAGNTDNGIGPDIFAPGIVTSKDSAVFSNTGFKLTDLGGTIPFGTDLKLGLLADNGGPTLTHLPLAGSPLIDAGFNAGPSGTDQRGPTYTRKVGTAADIGAIEFGSAPGIPTGGLSNFKLTQASGTTITFPVLWADDGTINLASLGSDDLRVTGPSGYNHLATLVSTKVLNAGRVEATYSIPANSLGNPTKWDGHDNGLYTINVETGSVTDGTNAVVADAIAAMTVNVPFPSASASSPDVWSADIGESTQIITVVYTHQVPIVATTLDSLDVRVTGPNGYSQLAVFKGSDPSSDSTTLTATYQITPPGGTWDGADAGSYSIAIEAGQVLDGDGIAVQPGAAGAFTVYLARTFMVNAVNDESTDTDGKLSLREAILTANASYADQPDTITFDSAIFAIPQTVAVMGGEIEINEQVVINGPGASLLTLVAGPVATDTNRFFFVNAGGMVAISGMTLSKGNTTGSGGAILDVGSTTLVLNAVVFDHNATAAGGGAVALSSGSLTAWDSVFVGNTSADQLFGPGRGGGAVLVSGGAGSVDIQRCTFTGNTAFVDGGAAAITDRTVSISASTFDHNSSKDAYGGAVAVYSGIYGVTKSTITNCTFVENSSGSWGGAIFSGGGTSLTVRNSTVTGNVATTGPGGILQQGMTLQSTVVSGNKSGAMTYDIGGISGPVGNNNWVGVSLPDIVGSGNLTGSDPMLGPLADNGGPTKTCKPLPGSPLINAGNNAAGLAFDQRGTGFLRVIDGKADIGAYEEQIIPPPRVINVLINNGAIQRSRVTTIAVTFSQQVNLPTNPADAFQLKRQSDNALVGLTAGVINGPNTVVTLTFSGALSEFGSLTDGRYTLTIDATKVSNATGQLDGNGDGTAGDNYELIGNPATNKLFRFFGDTDGNGTINSVDFKTFRTVFGLSGPSIFDSNGDNRVDANDFAEFRLRFGLMI